MREDVYAWTTCIERCKALAIFALPLPVCSAAGAIKVVCWLYLVRPSE